MFFGINVNIFTRGIRILIFINIHTLYIEHFLYYSHMYNNIKMVKKYIKAQQYH